MRVLLDLPWPPTTNTIWRRVGRLTVLSAIARAYRETIAGIACAGALRGTFGPARLSVAIMAYPPDKRARDLDNLLKAPLDALTHAGVWEDDSQIDSLRIERGCVVKGGKLTIVIEE